MINENKQSNKSQEIGNMPGSFSVAEIAIFKDSPHLVYLYKKTEKLVSALYILSSFISDKEPVKWQMREAGVELLSQGLSLSDRSSSERLLAYSSFVSTGLKFLSLLEVSYHGGIISEMNYAILKYEFEGLIKTAEMVEKGSDAKGLIFPEHFFEVPKGQEIQAPISNNYLQKHTANTQNGAMPDRMSVKKVVDNSSEFESKKIDKTNRQEIIISLLKKSPELGIKDFISSIKDCSEKTIQRELVSLVSKGLIKKVGEKRWSRYSLI